MNVIKIISMIALLFAFNATAVVHKYSSVQKNLLTNNTKLTKLEKKIAHNFNKLIRLSSKNIINNRLLISLKKDIKKSDTFHEYKVWPDNLLRINAANSLYRISKLCQQISNRKNKLSQIGTYLNQSAHRLCAKKYLSLLSSKSHKSFSFQLSQKSFFEENIKIFNLYQNRDEFKFFLSRFNKHDKKHQFYSKLITSYFMKSSEIPHKDLIRYLHLEPEFNKYLQTVDLDKKSTQRLFWREFNQLTESIRDLADNGGSKEEIQRKVFASLKFFNATLENQPKKKIYQSLLSLGKSLMRRGHLNLARRCYTRLLAEENSQFDKVFFEYIWSYIVEKDYSKVIALSKKYIKPNYDIYNNSKLSFWLARANAEVGNTKKSQAIYKRTIKRNPLSYYAILSSKILSEESKFDTEKFYLSTVAKNKRPKQIYSKIDTKWIKRMLAWSYVSNPTLFNLEYNQVLKLKAGVDLERHILLASFKLSENKSYLDSFKLIYRSIDKNKLTVTKDVLKILFPLPYISQIKQNTKDFDPLIALSLIRQESGFNRYAKSHVGARGLMQLMPNTAKRIKRWVKKKHLFNPNLNIKIGTKFFNKLLKKYDENLVYSLAAYNAGSRRIDDWQEKNYVNTESNMLNNIENIPFLETRKYVKLIFRNIFFYKMLIGDKKLQDSENFNEIYDIKVGFNR